MTIFVASGTPTFNVDIEVANVDLSTAYTKLTDGTAVTGAKQIPVPETCRYVRLNVNAVSGGAVGANLFAQK